MNRTLSLYTPGNSFVHRVSPLTKLLFVLLMLVTAYSFSDLRLLLAFFAGLLVLLTVARSLRRSLPIFAVSSIALLTIFIVQSIFFEANASVFFSIGNFHIYEEGLVFASRICLRVLILVAAFSMLIFTVDPDELVTSIVKRGLSPRLGYVVLSVFQIIPEMMGTVATITDAQRSRGFKTSGSLWSRAKGIFPLIGPVVMNSLIVTRERSMALEVRGFSRGGNRSFIREEKPYLGAKILPACLWFLLILLLVWRIFQWLK